MSKKRLIVTISYSFSIRYIVRSGMLDALKNFCEPVVIITWQQDDLIEELKAKGIEVHVITEPIQTQVYKEIRRKIDIWFDHFKLKGQYKKNQRNYLDQYIPLRSRLIRNTSKWWNVLKFYNKSYRDNFFIKEYNLLKETEAYKQMHATIKSLNADAVFTVTPFHRQEDILLRVCNDLGLKMLTAILSFDNITKRGWIPITYHVYMVWNKANKAQLYQIYDEAQTKEVYITGAPQFDFYFKPGNLFAKEEWKKIVGLPLQNNKKIILYAGGPQALFPKEPMYLKAIDKAINNGIIKDAVVLFRCHPIDKIERWKQALDNTSHIFFDASWTGNDKLGNTNVTTHDVRKLASTLAFTDVHINLCSTMSVDGSAFSKPQIGPAYLDTKHASQLLEQLYWQEHFIPVMQTGGVVLAHSEDELIQHINNALLHPENYTRANDQILDAIITYKDGMSTQRVVNVIQDYLGNLN